MNCTCIQIDIQTCFVRSGLILTHLPLLRYDMTAKERNMQISMEMARHSVIAKERERNGMREKRRKGMTSTAKLQRK